MNYDASPATVIIISGSISSGNLRTIPVQRAIGSTDALHQALDGLSSIARFIGCQALVTFKGYTDVFVIEAPPVREYVARKV